MTKPSRAISRSNSAETFGGSAEPSGVCSVARRSAAPRLRGGRPAQGWFEVANAQPGQGALHSVDDARALPDQALALPVGPLGVLFGNGRDARHGAVAPFPAQPPQEPPLQQLGVEPVGLGPAMFPRYGDTRGMDHMRLHPTRPQPARQPEAIAAGFEGQRNPRDLAAGLDRLVAPAMQQAKQPFCTRLQLLAWLALNAGKHTGNQPTRLAHLDDGNDRAILVQGDEGPAQVVQLGHRGTPSVHAATKLPFPRRPPHRISPLLTLWARSPFELIEMFLLVCMGLLGGVISVMRCFVDPRLKSPARAEFFYKPAAGAAISLGVYVLFRAAQIFLGVRSEAGTGTVSTSIFLLAGLGLASGFCATDALAQIEAVATPLMRGSGRDTNGGGGAVTRLGSTSNRGDTFNAGPAAAAATPG